MFIGWVRWARGFQVSQEISSSCLLFIEHCRAELTLLTLCLTDECRDALKTDADQNIERDPSDTMEFRRPHIEDLDGEAPAAGPTKRSKRAKDKTDEQHVQKMPLEVLGPAPFILAAQAGAIRPRVVARVGQATTETPKHLLK